jgi:hypothetical protein
MWLTLLGALPLMSCTVWQFTVEVNNGHVRRTFTAQTNTTWEDFEEEALRHFEKPRNEVSMAYRVSGDTCAVTYLICEYDWMTALARVKEKVMTARTRAVTMELKNMVSRLSGPQKEKTNSYLTWQMVTQRPHNNRRGRHNPNRGDDIPPEPSPEVLHQYECLRELQRYLICQEHTAAEAQPTYCWVEPATESAQGGHYPQSHQDMTLWAKHMVSGVSSTVTGIELTQINRLLA